MNNRLKKKMKRVLAFLILILFFLSCHDFGNYEIIPGKSVGNFILGSSLMNEIYKEYDASFYNNNGIFFSFEQGEFLTTVVIKNSSFVTKDGLRVGSSIEDVRKKLGLGKEGTLKIRVGLELIDTGRKQIIYGDMGILFNFMGDHVSDIVVKEYFK